MGHGYGWQGVAPRNPDMIRVTDDRASYLLGGTWWHREPLKPLLTVAPRPCWWQGAVSFTSRQRRQMAQAQSSIFTAVLTLVGDRHR
jgi:hypothetical protein